MALLNEVQIAFVNEAARPHIEQIIKAIYRLDTFVADYDAIQATCEVLPIDGTVLDDGRTDAPALTGADLVLLRNFSETMSGNVSAAAKEALIGKMVRSLNVVLGG